MSDRVMDYLHKYTALLKQISIDEAFIDVSDLRPSAEAIAREIQQAILEELGLPCSLGVATNKLVAKIANNIGKAAVRSGRPPMAITVVAPGQEATFLAPLAVGELWGIGPKMAEKLTELGMRTILNILGPLTNPAGAPNQVMGVFHPDLVGIQARVLKMLGSRHVLTVHGHDGLDEITITGPTAVAELKHDFITEYVIEPKQFGLDTGPVEAIQVAGPEESRARVLAVLGGEPGPSQDVVVLNAAAALYVSGVVPSLWDGVALARDTVASGAAKAKLDQLVSFTQAFAKAGA